MLQLFRIDLCNYTIKRNTVNCISTGQISLLRTPGPSEEDVARQTNTQWNMGRVQYFIVYPLYGHEVVSVSHDNLN